MFYLTTGCLQILELFDKNLFMSAKNLFISHYMLVVKTCLNQQYFTLEPHIGLVQF